MEEISAEPRQVELARSQGKSAEVSVIAARARRPPSPPPHHETLSKRMAG